MGYFYLRFQYVTLEVEQRQVVSALSTWCLSQWPKTQKLFNIKFFYQENNTAPFLEITECCGVRLQKSPAQFSKTNKIPSINVIAAC